MQARDPIEGGRAPIQRREALVAAAGTVAALGLAACSSDGQLTTTTPEDRELTALRELLALERRALATYEEGARLSGSEQAALLALISSQALEHVRALSDLIAGAGGERPPREVADIPSFIRDDDSAARAGRSIGTRLMRAYQEAIPLSPSPQRRNRLMTMLANDAEHVALLSGRAQASPGDPLGSVAAAGGEGPEGGDG